MEIEQIRQQEYISTGERWAGHPYRYGVGQGPGRGRVWSRGLHARGDPPGGLQHRQHTKSIYIKLD